VIRMVSHNEPVISVAIATWNYGRYLPRALDSVFRCHKPSDAPIQVVVVDHASTDNTRAVLADYRLRYPESLEVVRIPTREGLGAAKNAALDRCTGRTVALLDADDEFLAEKLVHCHSALESEDVDLVTNDFYHQTEDGDVVLRSRRTYGAGYPPQSTWTFQNGVVRFSAHCLTTADPDWVERRWRRVRHRHLDLPLNVKHLHSHNSSMKPQNYIHSSQAIGRLVGNPHPEDRLAPCGWACRECGSQYLLPTRCCGRGAEVRPLYFHWVALSPHHQGRPEFSLVIMTRNGLDLTRRAMTSLLGRVPTDRRDGIEFIFVDGCSTDGTLDYIRALADTHPVKLIVTHPSELFNYARACNLGATAAVGKYLFLLNNDIELHSEDPWEPLRAALEDPKVGVVGASTVWNQDHRDPEWESGSPPYLYVNRPVTGEFWGARREVYWELGGMDEAFAGYGYDELDFQFRAQRAHYHLALARVQVYHAAHGTFGPIYGSEAMEQMAEKNRWVFYWKHKRTTYEIGERIEPFASHRPPEVSMVVVVQDQGPLLRETLAHAARDAACLKGGVQVVVVDNASTDDTALAVEEARLRLPRCLTSIRLSKVCSLEYARQIGRARATGKTIRELRPGDWEKVIAPMCRDATPTGQ